MESTLSVASTTRNVVTREADNRFARALLAVAVAAIGVHLWWPTGSVGEWSYLVVTVGAAGVAWLGHRRFGGRITGLITLGVGLSAAGDVIYQVLIWAGRDIPDISPADIGWLGSYVAIGAALLAMLRSGAGERLDLEAWIDIGAVSLVALLLQWQFAIVELVTDSSTPGFVRMVWALYPALDSVLVALVVRALVSGRVRRSAAILLVGGAACWFLSDLVFAVAAPKLDISRWLNAGWLVGAVLLGAATWVPLGLRERTEDEAWLAFRVGGVRVALALVPLLLPQAVGLVAEAQGTEAHSGMLFAATLAMVLLAFLRAMRLSRSGDEARALLRTSERRARAIAANSSDAAAIVTEDATILSDSPELAALVGYPDTSTVGEDLFSLVSPVDVEAARAGFARLLRRPGSEIEAEVRVLHADGRLMWLGARLVDLRSDPDVGGILVNLHDVTDRKVIEQQLTHQAFHDALTGLANRALFADRVAQALRHGLRNPTQPAVIFLDLDGFKTVNDSLGHGAGDRLLCVVAERLAAAVRPGDTVARLGGDEFAVLLEQPSDAVGDAVAVAERILSSLADPIEVDDRRVTVSASLGIAIGSIDASAASVLRDADVAMYRAKAAGKGRWVVHDADMRHAAVERLQLELDLVTAVDEGQLSLVYQPVVDLETDDIVGFEALLRWHHPTLGVVPPERFVPVAEESGQILDIGAWVLREACATAARWRTEHPEHDRLSIGVNVSARQIVSPDLVVHVAEALAHSGLDPFRLVLEVTETSLVADAALAEARMTELRRLGVRLAIDDFGTGYSSISYLRQFPVDILKIDKSFISTIHERDRLPALVHGLLELAHILDLKIVAEGVEQDVQRVALRKEHCDLAQGYLFARPLEPAAVDQLLDQLTMRADSPIAGPTPVD